MKKSIEVLVPVLNERETLQTLVEGIKAAVGPLSVDLTIRFIDDGSTDGSSDEIDRLAQVHPEVESIHFRRNFGKSEALAAGFAAARSEIVFTMDADLQDDPKEIPRFLAKMEEGFDLVSGWKKRRHDPLGKTLPSKLFNKTIAALSGVKIHDFNCGFKAYRLDVVKRVKVYGELHRYIPALAASLGFRVGELEVEHHARQFGRSKYGLERIYRGLFDCMTVVFLNKYLDRPMHFFGPYGVFSLLAGLGICLWLTVEKIFGATIGERPLLTLGVLLLVVGVQFLFTGLLAQMIRHRTSNEPSRHQ